MNRITIILTAACLLAASTLALNPTTAHAKGHSAAQSHAATQNHTTPVTKAIQHNAQPAIQHIAKKSPKITTANTKLLTLAKKGPSNLKKFKTGEQEAARGETEPSPPCGLRLELRGLPRLLAAWIYRQLVVRQPE